MDYSGWNYNVSCCKEVIIGMRIVEMSGMAVATILTGIFILAQIRTKVLHSNLRALFLATCLADSVIMYSRIFDLLHTKGLLVDHVLILVAKYAGWMFDCSLLLFILFERYYAIKHNDTYDETSMNWPIRTMTALVAIFLVTITVAIITATGFFDRRYFILGMLVLALTVFASFFASLHITSKLTKRLEMHRFKLNQSNYVNGRFQAYESRRSHRMLRFYIPFQVGSLLTILTTASVLTLTLVPTHPTYFLLIQQSTYFFFIPRAIASMVIVLYLHPCLRRTTKQLIMFRSVEKDDRSESRSVPTSHVAVTSLSGKRLNFESEQQRESSSIMSNWSHNLCIPLTEWNFEVSCCRDAVVSLRIVEVASLIATTFVSLFYVRILATTKILHINLRLLFSVSVLNDLFLMALRIFDIINVSGLLDETDVLIFFKFNSWLSALVIILTIVCERIHSVRTSQTYDESSNSFPRSCILIIASEYLACMLYSWLMITGYVSRQTYVKSALLVAFLALLVFIFSVQYTSKHAKRIMEVRYNLMTNNIASRYQMIEAERSSRMLKWYIPFQVIMNISTLTCAISAILFIRSRTPQYYLVYVEFVYICIGPRVIGACVIAVTRHPALRKEWKRLLSKLAGRNLPAPETVTMITMTESSRTVQKIVQSSAGTQLSFAPEREQEMYFQGYANTWRSAQ